MSEKYYDDGFGNMRPAPVLLTGDGAYQPMGTMMQAKDDATPLGSGLFATFYDHHIILETRDERTTGEIPLDPPAFMALMRFARNHMGDEVFREVDRIAEGAKAPQSHLSDDLPSGRESPDSGENVPHRRP